MLSVILHRVHKWIHHDHQLDHRRHFHNAEKQLKFMFISNIFKNNPQSIITAVRLKIYGESMWIKFWEILSDVVQKCDDFRIWCCSETIRDNAVKKRFFFPNDGKFREVKVDLPLPPPPSTVTTILQKSTSCIFKISSLSCALSRAGIFELIAIISFPLLTACIHLRVS